jgi:hypothetical protein
MASWNLFCRKEKEWSSSTEGTVDVKYGHDFKNNDAEFDIGRQYRQQVSGS